MIRPVWILSTEKPWRPENCGILNPIDCNVLRQWSTQSPWVREMFTNMGVYLRTCCDPKNGPLE